MIHANLKILHAVPLPLGEVLLIDFSQLCEQLQSGNGAVARAVLTNLAQVGFWPGAMYGLSLLLVPSSKFHIRFPTFIDWRIERRH